MNKKQELIKDFERMTNIAKAKAYSKLSLERQLTEQEFKEYKKVMELIWKWVEQQINKIVQNVMDIT